MSDSNKSREALVEELSALRKQMSELQEIESGKARPEDNGRQSYEQRKATEQNAAILRASLDGIVIMDHEGLVVDFNASAESIFGYSLAQVVGKDMCELIIPPPMRERHRQGLARYLATGEGPILNKRLEMPACRADGTEFLCELTITPIAGEEHPLFTGFIRDITEQKALQVDQARLAAIVEFSLYAIVSKTVDGIIISWNHGAERLYGYSAQEVIGQSISILFAPDRFQEYVEIMKTVKKGISIPSYDTVRRRKDGTEVNVSVGISPIKKREGEIVEASTISHDITEQKASEEQMRLLLESTGEGIYGIDIQGRCTFINQAATAMLGYVPAEVIGQDMHPLVHHHRPDGSSYPVEDCPIYRSMQNQIGVRVHDDVLWRKDGTSFAAEYSAFPIIKKEHILGGAVVTFKDITQTKQLEEQFRQAQKMESVGRLAGGVAHDFNNLLTIISGYSEMVYNALPPGDSSRTMVSEIRKAGERACSLTRQLLAFSRKMVLQAKVLDLNSIMEDSGMMLRRLLGEDISISTVLHPSLGHVKTDPGQIEQAIMNLAVNARDAMPQGGRLTFETANVELDEEYCRTHPEVTPGRYVMLAVADDGCGMSEKTLGHLFEPFFTTKEPGKGTGLGLAMVYGFIKQSGGHVAVYSELGHGTTFKIYLPQVEEPLPGKSHPGIILMPTGAETILMVEDDKNVRTFTRTVLQTCGYTVLEASDGMAALRLAEGHQGPIHLLLTDVVMPSMSGRKVAELMAVLKPGVKALFTSGYTDDAVVRHGVLEAETHFLQKPYTPGAVVRKVREVLDA